MLATSAMLRKCVNGLSLIAEIHGLDFFSLRIVGGSDRTSISDLSIMEYS